MLARLHAGREERERGSAHAGLAVVAAAVVVALAATAVALTLAWTEEGSDATSAPAAKQGLIENGLLVPPRVSLGVDHADARTYCIRTTHENLRGYVIYISSETGVPSSEPCM